MAIARLTGGPLDGQAIPLENESDDTLIMPYSEGQLVYRREGGLENTGDSDGPTQAVFTYIEETEEINREANERDD
ncbi:response regulator [Microbacterium enclense]|uniref:Response regulator n=1 Tax=Microbacterium enclense TaxID=993073 RepID=A0A3S3L2X1_9MICO|nr:response regulator [Microbacterium enclense]MCT2085973.1 response regulator [Microbacterium enclense]RWR23178.1 response regulator [Microbacterium enclense]